MNVGIVNCGGSAVTLNYHRAPPFGLESSLQPYKMSNYRIGQLLVATLNKVNVTVFSSICTYTGSGRRSVLG